MATSSRISDLPTVEQRATAIGLRQLLRSLGAHGPPPVPVAAQALREQVPLLPSRTLREAVAKGFEVFSTAGLRGTSLRDLGPEGHHWHLVSTLALDELGRRETRALEELAAHPPAYLVAAIGRPDPEAGGGGSAARRSWVAVTAQVMAYRLQYGISDPTRALGTSPTTPMGVARETDWRVAMGEIRWSAGNLGEHLVDPRVLGVFDATGRVDPQQALHAINGAAAGAKLSEGRRQRIRSAPSHTLRQRVSEALGLVRQHPADHSAELERWAAARDTTATLYQQELAAGGHRRPGHGDHQKVGGHQQEQLSRRLADIDSGIARVQRAQDQRVAWEARHGERLATGRLATGELLQRESEALLALELDPPDYLVTELGRPPGDPAGRTTWRQGAGLIERYRTRYEIGDPSRALGDARDPRQRAHLALTRRQLDLVRDGLHLSGPAPPALPAPPYRPIPGQ